jgi:D-glycero-D-manno-heptose 1,7-bisphosphate phosphatase
LKWQKGHSTTNLIDRIIEINSKPTVKAVFLDRDGTINLNKQGYIHKIENFEFIPYAVEALQMLSKTKYKIIIISNQSGIGRRYYNESDLEVLNQWLIKTLDKKSIRIDRIYHCPHAPGDKCSCRKPNIGMLMQAVNDFGISLNKSWIIGDDPKDVVMGRMANVKTIKLSTKMPSSLKLQPNYYAGDLLEAANIAINER